MKNQKIEFKDLLKDDQIRDFPFSFKALYLVVNSNSRPAYSIKGRNMKSIQNENMLVKGNGSRSPISKFITE